MATEQQQEATKKAKESKGPSAAEYASRLRLNEQAALMLNVDKLVDTEATVGANRIKRKDIKYKNFCLFREGTNGHIDLTKRIYRNDSVKYLIKNVPTKILSSLLPTIKLYKIFYPNVDKGSRNKGYAWRVPFDDIPVSSKDGTSAFQEKSIEELLAGNGRFHGAGIKSFNYKYVGVNPAEVDTNILAELEIFFQNVADLVKPIPVTADQFLKPPPADVDLDFMYAHLAVNTPMNEYNKSSKRNEVNRKYFRLKAVVGYSEPSATFFENLLQEFKPDEIEKIKNAIRTSKVILYLTPTTHELSFEENGTVTMKISYIAAMSSNLIDLDCLSLTKKHDELQKEIENYDQITSSTRMSIAELRKKDSKLSQKQKQKEIEAREETSRKKISALQNELDNTKNAVYSEVFNRLIGLTKENNPQGQIYSALFNKTALGITGTKVEENSTQIRIKNLQKNRTISDYKSDSITDEDRKYLSVSNVPPRVPAPKNSNPKKPNSDKVETAQNIHEKRAEKNTRSSILERKPGYSKIKFIFLGDLLDIFCSVINTRISDPLERPRLVFTDFEIEIPTTSKIENGTQNIFDTDANYTRYILNIADIPISIYLLQQFFLDKIIKPRKSVYPLIAFINDILTTLIAPAIAPSVFGRKTVLNNGIRLSSINLTIPFIGTKGTESGTTDALTGKSKEENFSGVINEETLKKASLELFSERTQEECGNYLIFYCSNKLPGSLIGNKLIGEDYAGWINADEKNGVYHLSIGTDAGFIKKMSFSKTDMQFYKEARLQSSTGDKTIASFGEVYDVNLEMFGNNIYRPGDFFFIEPLFFKDKQAIDLQNKLGIGGYYQVLEVSNNISDNNFQTSIKSTIVGVLEQGEVFPTANNRSP